MLHNIQQVTPLHGKETEAGRTCCLREEFIKLKDRKGFFFCCLLNTFIRTFYERYEEIVAESLILKYFEFWDKIIVWQFE